MLDHRTPSAKCAYCVMWLDSTQIYVGPKQEQDRAFRLLTRLADANPTDLMIRWMLAVECRTWDRNEEGVAAYKIILDHWKPGPALVHQTYANLLDNLKRYDDALVARYQVVQMEPAGWSYDGLANTLHGLQRYDEACAAHAIATRISPQRSLYWSNWAVALNAQQKYDDAIAKCERSLKLAPTNGRAYWQWGVALDGQGKTREALEKCKMAKITSSDAPKLDEFISDLEKRLQTSAATEPVSTLTKGE